MELLLDASLPSSSASLARQQRGVLTTVQLRRAGLSDARIHDVGRRDGWRPLLRGTRLVAVHDGDDALEDLARSWNHAASLVLPSAVLARDSALRELRVAGLPFRDGVCVAVPPGAELRGRAGLEVLVTALAPEHVTTSVWGLAMTTAVRALADTVPRCDRPTALSVLDSARRRGATEASLAGARALVRGHRGCRAVDDLWELADPDAETPLESRVRLRMIDGRLAPDRLQQKLKDASGRVYARPDMTIDRERRRRPHRGPLFVEADGVGPHGSPTAAFRDRDKTSAITADGGDVERFTWRDTLDPMRIPWRLRRAL